MSANIEDIFYSHKQFFEKLFFSRNFHFLILNYVSFSYFYTLIIYDMELQGTVKKLFETQTFGSGFQKREMILLTQEQYPQPISIEFLSDKINLLDNVSEGESVKIGINIRGREWTNPQGEVKYFNSISAWRLEKSTDNAAMPTSAGQPTQAPASNTNPFSDEEDDDLPF